MHSKKLKSNIWKYYLAAFLGGIAFFYNSIDTIYYRHWDLSFNHIGMLLSTALIASLLFEIPSGLFADIYGRKKSLVIGSILNLVGVSFMAFGSTFTAFIFGFAFWGTGSAFNSGAGSALFYDSLRFLGLERDYIKHSGRLTALFISFDIISGFAGPLLFAINVRLPYFVSWAAAFIVIAINLTLFEKVDTPPSRKYFVRLYGSKLNESIKQFLKNKSLIKITLFGIFLFVINKGFSEVIGGNYPLSIGFNLTQLGVMFLIASLLQTIFVFFSDKTEKKLSRNKSLLILIIGIPSAMLIYALSRNFIASGLLLGIYYGLLSFSEVIVDTYQNRVIKSEENRATILSMGSMLTQILSLAILPLFGFFVDMHGMYYGILLLVTVLVTLGPLLIVLNSYKKQ